MMARFPFVALSMALGFLSLTDALTCSIKENMTPDDYDLSSAAKMGIKHRGSNTMKKFQAFHCVCNAEQVRDKKKSN